MKKYLIGGNDYTGEIFPKKSLLDCHLEIGSKKIPISITNAEICVDHDTNAYSVGSSRYSFPGFQRVIISAEVIGDNTEEAVSVISKAIQNNIANEYF